MFRKFHFHCHNRELAGVCLHIRQMIMQHHSEAFLFVSHAAHSAHLIMVPIKHSNAAANRHSKRMHARRPIITIRCRPLQIGKSINYNVIEIENVCNVGWLGCSQQERQCFRFLSIPKKNHHSFSFCTFVAVMPSGI